MAASWFWNTPDREGVRRLRIAAARVFQRNSLAKRAGWLISCSRNSTMNPAANHCPLPKFALWSLALDSVRQIFRPFGPLFPRNPFFPALRSGHRLFQQPSPGKQFLSSGLLAPFSPATPFSPPSGPATGSSNSLHRESNFLAVECGQIKHREEQCRRNGF
jgi:hypothetical protein